MNFTPCFLPNKAWIFLNNCFNNGRINLNNKGVAAAEAVATTAIAAVVLTWEVFGKYLSVAVLGSYKTMQVFLSALSSWPTTFSYPLRVRSPTLGWFGAGHSTSFFGGGILSKLGWGVSNSGAGFTLGGPTSSTKTKSSGT